MESFPQASEKRAYPLDESCAMLLVMKKACAMLLVVKKACAMLLVVTFIWLR
jgi:hypothetical protein